MPCDRFETQLPDGTTIRGIICHRGRRAKAKPCAGCGAASSRLCDAPIVRGQTTCDAPICDDCAVSDGPDLDFCPAHVAPRGFVARDRAEWDEFFSERAAILQFVGGVTDRREAERGARRLSGPRPSMPIQPPGWFKGQFTADERRAAQTGKFAGVPAKPPAQKLGPANCRSCGKRILFASTTAGKVGPFEPDPAGKWTITGGIAMPADQQLELLSVAGPARYTSHFATCPQAAQWRSP